MRTISLAAFAVIAAALAGTAPAAAAVWTCNGPEYVCGSAPSAHKSSYSKPSYAAPSKRKATKAAAVESSWWFSPAPAATKSKKAAWAEPGYTKPKRAAYAAPKVEKAAWTPSWSGFSGGGSHYQSGQASYYWQPQKVASGGNFNPNAMTAAHKTLPFGTKVRVTNQRNGQSVVVTINDRGPYVAGRVIDLSSAAAGAINMKGAGVAPVSLAVLGK